MVPNWRERDVGAWREVEPVIANAAGPRDCRRGRHFSPRADGSIVSEVSTLPGEAFEFSRARKCSDARRGLFLGALTPHQGCANTLRRNAGHFEVATNGQDCPGDFCGAKYASGEACVRSQSIETCGRGYSASCQQVGGSKVGLY